MSTVFFSVGMTLDGFIAGIIPMRPAHASIPGDGGQPDRSVPRFGLELSGTAVRPCLTVCSTLPLEEGSPIPANSSKLLLPMLMQGGHGAFRDAAVPG